MDALKEQVVGYYSDVGEEECRNTINLHEPKLEKNLLIFAVNEETARRFNVGTLFTRIDELFNDNLRDQIEHNSLDDYQLGSYLSCCRKATIEGTNEGRVTRTPPRRSKRVKRQNETWIAGTTTVNFNCRDANVDQRIVNVIDAYNVTLANAQNFDCLAASDLSKSKTSNHGTKRNLIWKTSVLGADIDGHDIAHLVPASSGNADSYWFVADFLFGCYGEGRHDAKTSEIRFNLIRRLIHGTLDTSNKRHKNTGIKNMVTNKVMLASQRDYFDNTPCVTIFPIYSVEEAKTWTGQGYDAIMLIDEYDDDDDNGRRATLQNVVAFTGYSSGNFDSATSVTTADHSEIKKAINLCRKYTLAILYAQLNLKPESINFSMNGNISSAYVPKELGDEDTLTLQNDFVRKVSFQNNSSSDGHPAPDPLLLLTKSITVLQRRHNFNIVAAAEPSDEFGRSDASLAAEEAYLKWRESCIQVRNPIGMDIIV